MPIKMRLFAPLLLSLIISGCFDATNSVSISKEGQGLVTGEDIDCGGDCQEVYSTPWVSLTKNIFTQKTVTAEPEPGYEFFGWAGTNYSVYGSLDNGCTTNKECTLYLETDCPDSFAEPRPYAPCFKLGGGAIDLTAIFVEEDSIAYSDWDKTNSACLIDKSGQLKCWGDEIGEAVPAAINPTTVKVSQYSACVQDDTGLNCWGRDLIAGENVPNFTNLQDFDVSNDIACAIDDGDIKCWGRDASLYLPAMPLSNPSNIRVDYRKKAVCVEQSGVDECWGPGIEQLTQLPNFVDPVDMSISYYQNCVIDSNQVKCSRNGDFISLNIPTLVNGTAIASSGSPNGFNVCVIDNGSLRCWWPVGADPENMIEATVPDEIQNAVDISMDETGSDREICGFVDNVMTCWDGFSEVYRYDRIANVTAFDLDGSKICATNGNHLVCDDQRNRNFFKTLSLSNPSVVASGRNIVCVGGASGLECFRDYHADLWVYADPIAEVPTDLTGVTDLDLGLFNGCAIHSNQVTCWGSNDLGLLNVPALINPKKINVARNHACAIDDTGLVCWGETIPN